MAADKLDFKDLVVVITGAGAGLGRCYGHFFASRGSKVVINDVSAKSAETVVQEIKKAGGQAIAAAGSVAEGDKIIAQAVKAYGTVHVLINNAGILRDKSFKKMSDEDFDLVTLVHLKGAYSCTKAAFPIFRQQKFGRIINTSSAAGIYGNVGQANYSAAKMGLVGFTRTIAREGAKHNVKCNVIAPLAASAMLATVMPPEVLKGLRPEHIAPFVGVLSAKNGPDVNGRIFELAGGYFSEIRYERSRGHVFRVDDSFTPSAVAAKWEKIADFTGAEHPVNSEDGNMMEHLEQAKKAPKNPQGPHIDFKGKTAVITGAGAGLGRAYALMFAKLGGNVVVNDVNKDNAENVVKECERAGGKAVAAVCSAEEGEQIVKAGVDAFGTVHILVANAGILRDKSFMGMDEKMWDQVISVHLRGTYKCAKACWPIFQNQKFGRIITTASPNGIYGTIGQANYSTAKAAIAGLTRTLAFEGAKNNIKANCIAPRAGTAMTATVWPQELLDVMKPDFIAPVVGYLASDKVEDSGTLHEVFGGYIAKIRFERSYGAVLPNDIDSAPEDVVAKWAEITKFDNRSTHPLTGAESAQQIMANFENVSGSGGSGSSGASDDDPEDTDAIKKAKKFQIPPEEFSYTERDVMLYNLGIGAKADELQWVYENADNFQALPTFGVIPQFGSSSALPFDDFIPNFSPAKLLHGEQYLRILKPIPTGATMVNQAKLVEVLDKGKAASVTFKVETKDKATGEVIFENQGTVVLRGSGGFGGKKNGADRGNATALNVPPKRQPDAVVEEKTTLEQAAIYRLSGDYNPLHIDPGFASMGGWPKPILHGLCSFGIAGKHVLKTFGPYSDIKVRFAGTVIPGETLVTEMWKEGNKVIFATKVKERDAPALSHAAVTLADGAASSKVKAKL